MYDALENTHIIKMKFGKEKNQNILASNIEYFSISQ